MSSRKFSRTEQNYLVSKGKKGCSKCGEVLPTSCFGKQKTKIGFTSFCKYCRHIHDRKKDAKLFLSKEEFWFRHKTSLNRIVDRKGKVRNQERDRVNFIKSAYKVDFETAIELYKKSTKGKCSICRKTPEQNNKALAIDHCHNTGKVRGILCSKCNKGLGHFMDNSNILKKAIKYLNGH